MQHLIESAPECTEICQKIDFCLLRAASVPLSSYTRISTTLQPPRPPRIRHFLLHRRPLPSARTATITSPSRHLTSDRWFLFRNRHPARPLTVKQKNEAEAKTHPRPEIALLGGSIEVSASRVATGVPEAQPVCGNSPSGL